jgi:hypothetical protein
MSRGRAKFTQAELRRATKVAGNERTVEIAPDGTIRLIPLSTKPPETPAFDTREPLVF